MADFTLTRKHSGWDVVLGGGLVVVGLVILGNAVIATRVSVQFLGWMLVIAGVAGLLGALLSLRSGGFWHPAIGGAVFLVAGLMCLRHVHAAALTLTLIVGSLFLLTGVVRLFAAAAAEEGRWALLFGGAVSTVAGARRAPQPLRRVVRPARRAARHPGRRRRRGDRGAGPGVGLVDGCRPPRRPGLSQRPFAARLVWAS